MVAWIVLQRVFYEANMLSQAFWTAGSLYPGELVLPLILWVVPILNL